MEDGVRAGSSRRPAPSAERFGPAGTQTLVRSPANASSLSALPERAYDNLLVVAARDHPRKIAHRLERDGHDPADVGVVPVTPTAGEYDGDLWTTDPVQPADLTGIGMRFSDAVRHLEPGRGWVLVDALGVLLMYTDESRVSRFFQTLTNRVRARDLRGVYCVSPDAVPAETYERLRTVCDGECDLRRGTTDGA